MYGLIELIQFKLHLTILPETFTAEVVPGKMHTTVVLGRGVIFKPGKQSTNLVMLANKYRARELIEMRTGGGQSPSRLEKVGDGSGDGDGNGDPNELLVPLLPLPC